MKNKLVLFTFLLLGWVVNAQNKNGVHDIHVKGNCGLCKDRIEKAAYKVKGVKSAEWDSTGQNLHIILNETKSTVEDVKKSVASVGHDTDTVKADDEVYKNLHSCCVYDREDESTDEMKEDDSQPVIQLPHH